MPKVSVVIPAYNYGQFIAEAIKSVLDQGFSNLELIVLNNASTDNTHEVIQSFLSDKRLIYVDNERNLGATNSVVKGFNLAKGEYITLLPADDYWLPGSLSFLVKELDDNPDAGFAYGRYVRINKSGSVMEDFCHHAWDDFDHHERPDEVGRLLGRDCYISMISLLFRKTVLDQFPLSKDYTLGDYEYFLRLSANKVCSRFVNVPLAVHRFHGNQMSNNPELFSSGKHLNESLLLTERCLKTVNPVSILGYEEEILNMLNIKTQMFINHGGKVTSEIQDRALAVKAKLQELKEQVRPLSKIPLVSIVIVTQNNISLLREALFSIQAQSYTNIEIIVINNGGRPAGPIVADADLHVHYIELRHALSNGAARNIGVRFSKGEVICYLDDNDTYLANHIQVVVEELKKNDIDFTCTRHKLVPDNGNLDRNIIAVGINPRSNQTRLLQCVAPISTWGHKKNLIYSLGRFDENNLLLDDLDYLYRVIVDYDIKKIPIVTVSTDYEMSHAQVNEHQTQLLQNSYEKINTKNASRMDAFNNKLAQFLTVEQGVDRKANASEHRKNLMKETGESLNESILLVAHNFVPYAHAGVEIYTYRLAKEMIAQGKNVSVFFPVIKDGIQEPYIEKSIYNGIACFQLMTSTFGLMQLQESKTEVLFQEFISSQHFDVIHFQHIFKLPLTLLAIAGDSEARVLFTAHDHYLVCPRINLIRGDGRLCDGPTIPNCSKCLDKPEADMNIWKEGIQVAMEGVDCFIAPSKYLKDILVPVLNRKIVLNPYGIIPVSKKSGLHDRIVYVGTIVGFKGVHDLISAYIKANIELPLDIWGSSPIIEYTNHITNLSNSHTNIHLHGAFEDAQLPDILASARVLVVPSYRDNSPLVVREAFSAGVPVIAANVGGIPEMVMHGENGYLFESGDVQRLAELLREFEKSETFPKLAANIKEVKTVSQEVSELMALYTEHLPKHADSHIG